MALPFHSLAGFHVCAAGWMAKGRVGYPIVKPGPNCGFGKTGIIDYGVRLNRSERWDAYCYNPHGLLTTTVLYFTKQLHVTKRLFKRNGFFFQRQISLVMIIIKYKDHSWNVHVVPNTDMSFHPFCHLLFTTTLQGAIVIPILGLRKQKS